MRKINKPAIVPAALAKQQRANAQRLKSKGSPLEWNSNNFNGAKSALQAIYHNKCGFCERTLLDASNFSSETQIVDNQFTIEHYRPKSKYWWLGDEWTNLFPLCWRCNNKKDDTFLVVNTAQQANNFANPPYSASLCIDRHKCNITSSDLETEAPLLLNPEVDIPEFFLEINQHGKVLPKFGLSLQDQARVAETIKILNLYSHEEDRKTYIAEQYEDNLQEILILFVSKVADPYEKKDLEDSFFPFFKKMIKLSKPEKKYSLLALSMLRNFENNIIKNPKITLNDVHAQQILRDAFVYFLEKYQ